MRGVSGSVAPGKSHAGEPADIADVRPKPNLTLIHVPPGRANRQAAGISANRAPNMDSIISHQPLNYNRYLNKLPGVVQRPADVAQ